MRHDFRIKYSLILNIKSLKKNFVSNFKKISNNFILVPVINMYIIIILWKALESQISVEQIDVNYCNLFLVWGLDSSSVYF